MDVWDRLGIEKTDDERAIKRAYAKQLKAIRPDEDPAAFQALREARDEAIYLAQFDFDYEWDEEIDDEDGDEGGELSKSDHLKQPQEASSTNSQNLGPNGETSDIIELALRESEPKSDETYLLTLEEGEPLREPVGERAPLSHEVDKLAIEHGQQMCPEPSLVSEVEGEDDPEERALKEENKPGFYDVEIDAISYEQIDDELENLMGPWGLWDETAWVKFIRRIRDCSFDLSNYAEYEIMHLLGENLNEQKQESEFQREARKLVLSFLNSEYGWTQNDRRVYAALPDDQAEALMDFLRYGEEEGYLQASETFYDAFGFPLLTEQHFKDYLGKNGSVYETYYNHCKEGGRDLKPAWSWPGFLFSPLWLSHRCNDGMEALTGMIYVLALILLHYGLTSPSLIASLLGGLMIISTHVLVGIYGKKLVVTTLANSLQELHSNPKLSDAERLKKLAYIGRGGFKAFFDFIVGMAGIGLIAVIIYRLII